MEKRAATTSSYWTVSACWSLGTPSSNASREKRSVTVLGNRLMGVVVKEWWEAVRYASISIAGMPEER